MTSTVPAPPSPWHPGELALQARVGVEQRMDVIGRRVIRDHLLDQHRAFFPLLPFLLVGSVDGAGDAWATLIAGRPGFVTSPDPRTLAVTVVPGADDPATDGLRDGAPVGLLGIELRTRRRNRANGTVRHRPGGFSVDIGQSFGNCPQYIQLRDYVLVRDPAQPSGIPAESMAVLDEAARRAIRAADTFFVASFSDDKGGMRQVDVSHRGGKPGFVRVEDDTLTIPDFAGNLFFATLGNILLNGKAGLVFADFGTGDLLQLTGDAELVLDGPEIAAFEGAERFWRFRPRRIVRRRDALPLRWALRANGWSPNALTTGDWQQTAARLRAAALAEAWRPFRVERVVDESSIVRSFYLAPVDGAGLVPAKAGQHLPIRLRLPGEEQPVVRAYTLSSGPSDGNYRISVKRSGAVSGFLHDHLQPGDLIEARTPAGHFTIDAGETRPAVLVAAGIGITPMLAMLRHILAEGLRTRHVRPTWLVYGAHTRRERAFDAEIAGLVAAACGAVHLTRVLGDAGGAGPGDYDRLGRIDAGLLAEAAPLQAADIFLCGPSAFMQATYDGLRALGVRDCCIHAEAFGPSALQRRGDEDASAPAGPQPSRTPVPVAFLLSGKEARWTPDAGSLLDLAEARGLTPAFSCRAGACGTCRTAVLNGEVAYPAQPTASVGPGEALICVARPAEPRDSASASLQLAL